MSHPTQTIKLRLYPEPRILANEEEIYQNLDLPEPVWPARPYVLVNMVGSVDGRSCAGGKASGIGSRVDRGAMRSLRSRVDAVMVGAGTLRAEKLNLGLDDPDATQPLAVVVGGVGELPINARLVGLRQSVVLVLPEGSPEPGEAERDLVTVLRTQGRGSGRADLGWLLSVLRSEYAVDRLLVEGGSTLNRALIDECLIDEVFLTIAPKLLLGQESAILSGSPGGKPSGLDLLSVHSADDELFLRYRIKGPR